MRCATKLRPYDESLMNERRLKSDTIGIEHHYTKNHAVGDATSSACSHGCSLLSFAFLSNEVNIKTSLSYDVAQRLEIIDC